MDKKIKDFEKICKICRELQLNNKKIVFVHGIFDILHRGHTHLLVEAKKLGDFLVVGVDHDNNARKLKGNGRPINNHESRMFVLSNIEPVDYVFLIPAFSSLDKTHIFYKDVYLKLKPDIVATSMKVGKYGRFKLKQAKLVGAKFVDISDYIHTANTTRMIKLLDL